MYTSERNIQIVISLLKAHKIRRIIASPGSLNYSFLASIQNDPDFDIYSCADERSAAYMACGMASETGQPVALSCTIATASRDYMPGLTEAYYRKLPILAITSTSTRQLAGQLIGQQLDRSSRPVDLVVESVYLPSVKDRRDELYCEREANKAFLALYHNGGGPVHIDLGCCSMGPFKVESLPHTRTIWRYTHLDELPEIPKGRIAIMLGVHKRMNAILTDAIDRFCATYDAIVLCVNPKSYAGAYAVNAGLLFSQVGFNEPINNMDLCIHIGEVNTDAIGFTIRPKEVWRVNEDGCIRDRYDVLTKMFDMSELEFFNHYGKDGSNLDCQLKEFQAKDSELRSKIPELPFSNAWIAQTLAPQIPVESEMYLGILNSLRMWDYAKPSDKLYTNANTGGFGIDGCISSMVGASILSPDKEFYGIFGDLAFFYDMNVLGNRHVGKNLHIILVNNDGGQQFRNFDHPAHMMNGGEDLFIAAAGHNGPKSPDLVKHYAEDLGFRYLSASSKDDFQTVISEFFKKGSSVILEVFTTAKEEGEALNLLRNLSPHSKSMKDKVKEAIIDSLGGDKIAAIKTLLGY